MRKDFILIGTLLCFATTANATVWYVHPDSALNSIQAGIDSCSNGDTVLVGAGIYFENINFKGKAITVKSEHGPDTTIIDGSNPAHPDTGSVVHFISGEGTNSVLEGFTITNGTGTNINGEDNIGGGVLCYDSDPTVVGNIIAGNIAGGGYGGGGIDCCFGSTPIIIGNTIVGNADHGICGPMYIGTISGNTIANNTKDGIFLETAAVLITDNIITGNTKHGINGDMGEYTIINNTVSGNGSNGINIGAWTETTVDSNTVTNNGGNGIFCAVWYYSYITNNIVKENADFGIVSYSDAADVSNNIVTENGGGIYIGPGFDFANTRIRDNTIINNHAYCGGGIFLMPCGWYHFTYSISGNMIEGNTADSVGGAIYVAPHVNAVYNDGGRVWIDNNIIIDNHAVGGGGIWASDLLVGANVLRIANNIIKENMASRGGGVAVNKVALLMEAEVMITSNLLTRNTASLGAGILCSDSSEATISYCTVSANLGDGVYCDSGAYPVANYNNITDNTDYGVRNVDPNVIVDATYNWWGDASGPSGIGPGTGDEVSEWVNYSNWFTRPVILRDTLDLKPDAFNKKRHGKFVTAYLEMRDGCDPEDIDISEVRLYGNIPGGIVRAEPKPTCVGDYDGDGYPDRMIKFNAERVNNMLGVGDSVKILLVYLAGSGYGDYYEATDYIRVIEPGGPQSADSEGITALRLDAVYPNPFVGNAVIRFNVSHSTKVTLQVFDISGRLVRTLINREVDAGSNTLAWDGADDSNIKLPSGVYFLKFEVEDYRETNKLILLR